MTCEIAFSRKNALFGHSGNLVKGHWQLYHLVIPAAIATLAAVLISIPQFLLRKQEFTTEPGACYYIEVVLVFINLLLCVVSYLSYAKARKTNFPKQRNPYEISADNYR